MMPSIPAHFIIAKSEASFVNSQVITDKIQEQIKNGKRLCWNSLAGLSRGHSTAEAFKAARLNVRTPLLAEILNGQNLSLIHI